MKRSGASLLAAEIYGITEQLGVWIIICWRLLLTFSSMVICADICSLCGFANNIGCWRSMDFKPCCFGATSAGRWIWNALWGCSAFRLLSLSKSWHYFILLSDSDQLVRISLKKGRGRVSQLAFAGICSCPKSEPLTFSHFGFSHGSAPWRTRAIHTRRLASLPCLHPPRPCTRGSNASKCKKTPKKLNG